jgi:hypothetical protein
MPQRIQELRRLLDELEEELHGIESLDDKSRMMLKETAKEIQAALQKEDVTSMEHQTMSAGLNDVISEFKSSHPTLYAVVNRMVDVLGQMGI